MSIISITYTLIIVNRLYAQYTSRRSPASAFHSSRSILLIAANASGPVSRPTAYILRVAAGT